MEAKYEKVKGSEISRFFVSGEEIGMRINDGVVTYFNLPCIDIFRERGEGSGKVFSHSSIGSNSGEEFFSHASSFIGFEPRKVYMLVISEDQLGIPFVDLIFNANKNEAPDLLGVNGNISENIGIKEKEEIDESINSIFDFLSIKNPASARGLNENVKSSTKYISEGSISGFISRQSAVININFGNHELYFGDSKILDILTNTKSYQKIDEDLFQLMISSAGMSSSIRLNKKEHTQIMSEASKFKLKCNAIQKNLDPIRLDDITKVATTIKFLEKKLDGTKKYNNADEISSKDNADNKNENENISRKLGGIYKSVNDNAVPFAEIFEPSVGVAFKTINAIFFAYKTAGGIKKHLDRKIKP